MLPRLALSVVLAVPALARAQGGYVEPPPSPPREAPAQPSPATVEPPVRSSAGDEKPSTTTSTSTSTTTSTPEVAPAPPPTAPSTPTPPPPPAYEPYSPPGMTWGGTPTVAAPHDPSLASTAVIVRAVELSIGVLAQEGGGMVEAGLLADAGRWAMGALLSAGGVNEHLGLGVHLAGGPRFPLRGIAWLDLQLDAGLVFFGDDGSRSALTSSTGTSGSGATEPAVGARLGLTLRSPGTRWSVSLGAGIRHVQRETVHYTVTDCRLLSACVTTPATATYGGTIAGAFLTVGESYPRGR